MGGFLYIFIVAILSLKVLSVQGNGRLSVQLTEYRNPDGRDYHGVCCDGPNVATDCIMSCDLSFRICLLSDVKNGSCTNFRRFTSPVAQNNIVFTGEKPTLFDFQIWQGEETIVFEVYDEDGTNGEDASTLLDVLQFTFTTPSAGRDSTITPLLFNTTGSRPSNPSHISVKVKAYCDQFFYGGDCARKCVHADGCDGHYNCDENGGKICLPGWQGDQCDTVISGSSVDCDTYYQATNLRNDTWIGMLICPGGTAYNAQLTIQNVGQTTVDLTLVLANVTYSLQGNEVGGFLTDRQSMANIHVGGHLINSTFFEGSVIINGTNCEANLHSQPVFGHICGVGGQCIRYDNVKDHYYCCCSDGSTSLHSCSSSATPATTVSVSTTSSKATSVTTSTPVSSTLRTQTSHPTESTPKSSSSSSLSTSRASSSATTMKETSEQRSSTSSLSTTTSEQIITSKITSSTLTSTATTQESTTPSSSTTSASTTLTSMESTSPTSHTTVSSLPTKQTTSSILTTGSTTKFTSGGSTTSPKSSLTPHSTSEISTKSVSTPSKLSTVTTTIKTPTTTKIISEGEKLKLALLLATEELFLLKDKIFKELANIWKNYNHLAKDSNITVSEVESDEAIDEDGQDVMVTEYTIGDEDNNNSSIKNLQAPPHDVIQKNVSAAINVNVYNGSKLVLKNTTHHLYLSKFSPFQMQHFENSLSTVWNSHLHSRNCPGCLNIRVVKTDEYISTDLESIYKIYYVVEMNNTIVTADSSSFHLPTLEAINTRLRVDRQTFFVVLNITGLVNRYRFHYDLLIEGYIYSSSYILFQRKLEEMWRTSHKGATDIDVHVIGTEKYIGDNNKELISLIYFVSKGGHIYSPVFEANPSTEHYQLSVNVTSPLNKPYVVYMGTLRYRMKYSMNIYVEDLVDVNDLQHFETQFSNHWMKKGNYHVEILHHTTTLTSKQSKYATQITYFLLKDHRIFDGRKLHPYYTGIVVKKGNGESYKVHTYNLGEGTNYVAIRKHFYFYVDGELTVPYSNLETLLKVAWHSYISEVFTVTVRWHERYENIHGKLFTKFYYVIHLNGHIVDASKDLHNISAITDSFKQRFELQYVGLHLHFSISNAYSMKYSFLLNFSTKLAKLDYFLLQNYIMKLWITQWAGFAHCNCLHVTVIPQMEHYHPIGSIKLWSVHYYLHQTSTLVYPYFVTNHISSVWNYTSVKGKLSSLSKEQTKSLYAFNYHHSLYFQTRPSKLDWLHIQSSLTSAWNTQLHANTTITMKEILEQKTDSQQSAWELVYFIKKKEHLLSPLVTGHLNMSFLGMHFLNAYGTHYKPFGAIKEMHWPASYSFNVFANTSLSVKYHESFKKALEKTWAEFLTDVQNTTFKHHLVIGNQIPIKISDNKYIWKIPVFFWYNHEIVDSATWPLVDTEKLAKYFGHKMAIRFSSSIDNKFLLPKFHLYFNSKVHPDDIKHVEESIKKEYCHQKKEDEHECANVKVTVTTQQETFDHKGDSHWKVQFTISTNGSASHPKDVEFGFKVNTTRLTGQINTNTSGGPYHVEHIAPTEKANYLTKKDLTKLYFNHWISDKNREKIKDLVKKQLEKSLEDLNMTSDVTVNVLNPKEYVSEKGKSVWGMSVYAAVNGTIQPLSLLPNIDLDTLDVELNHTLPNGQKLHVLKETNTIDAKTLFSVVVNHKVPVTLYGKMEAALTSSWKAHHGYTEHDHVKIKIKKQEEFIDKKGHAFWKLFYTLSVNGTTVLGSGEVFRGTLETVRGPNGVKYVTHTGNGLTSTKDFLSLYMDRHVSNVNKHQIEEAVKNVFLKTNTDISGNVTVTAQRQVEFVDKEGKPFWRWDFTVSLNHHHIRKELVKPLSIGNLEKELQKISSPHGEIYGIVDSKKTTLMQNNTLFAIYIWPKATSNKVNEFEKHLTASWQLQHPGWVNVSVGVLTQEEIVNPKTGKSLWKLVYMLNLNDRLGDSRLIDDLNSTLQKSILVWRPGREGLYQILLHHSNDLRYSSLFSVFISNKLSHKGLASVQHILQSGLLSSNSDFTNQQIHAFPIRQEEYLTSNGSSVWKLVYELKVDGITVLPSSVYEANVTVINEGLHAILGPKKQTYQVISSSTLYNYRNHFSIFFDHKSIKIKLPALKNHLNAAWTEHFKICTYELKIFESEADQGGMENTSCDCHTIISRVEEVVDHAGNTLWKIVYFLKSNETVIEPMATIKPHIGLIQQKIEHMETPAGSQFKVMHISESATIRTSHLFTLYSSIQLNLENRKVLVDSVKSVWSHCPGVGICNVKVEIRRQDRYIIKVSKSVVWAVRYSVHKDNSLLDPSLEDFINITHLKEMFSQNYTLETFDFFSELNMTHLNYHYHFAMYLSQELKQIKLTSIFSNPLKMVWSDFRGINSSTVSVFLSGLEEWVDLTGISYWKIVCFIFEDGKLIDAEIESPLNITSVQHEIQELHREMLIHSVPSHLHRYSSSFSLFLNNAVKLEDKNDLTMHLRHIWISELQSSVEDNNITAVWARQESYVGGEGKFVWKVVYFLLHHSQDIISHGLKLKNMKALKEKVSSLGVSHGYYIIEETDSNLIKRQDLFFFSMRHPILQRDKKQVTNNIKIAAISKYSSASAIHVAIVNQVAGIDSKSGLLMWKIFYSIAKGGVRLRANIEEKISHSSLKNALNLVRGNTQSLYKTSLLQESQEFVQFSQTFTFYTRQRVARIKYHDFETMLLNEWLHKLAYENIFVKDFGLKIIGQHEAFINEQSSRKYISGWKLMYVISSSNQNINAENIRGLNMSQLQSTVNIVSPTNVKYSIISSVTNSLRRDQLYSVVLSKRIFKNDEQKFKLAIGRVFNEGVFKMNITVENVRSEQVVTVEKNKKLLWRHTFIVHDAVTGNMVDANTHDVIQVDALQSKNFHAADLFKYMAVYTFNQNTLVQYSSQFSVKFSGRVPLKKYQHIMDLVKKAWHTANVTDARNIDIVQGITEEYIGHKGAFISKFGYFVQFKGSYLSPITVVAPAFSKEHFGLNIPPLYEGNDVYKYSECYTVTIRIRTHNIKLEEVKKSLEGTWNEHIDVKSTGHKAKIHVIAKKQFIGQYGIHVTEVLYTVSVDNTRFEPDYILHPAKETIQKAAVKNHYTWHVYSRQAYRKSNLFSITLMGDVKKSKKQYIHRALTEVWRKGKTNVSVELIGMTPYISPSLNSSSSELSQILYSVSENNMRLKSWTEQNLDIIEANKELKKFSQLSNITVWTQASLQVRSFYVLASTRQMRLNKEKLKTAIEKAWKSSTGSSEVACVLVSIVRYVSSNWDDIAKVSYTVSINSTHINDDDTEEPSNVVLNKELTSSLKKHQCDCSVRKLQKMYVKGKSLDVKKIHNAVLKTWKGANTDISLLGVHMKAQLSNRRKRETKPSGKLVNDNLEDISPAHYSVDIDGEEPNNLFVQSPTDNKLVKNLKDSGAELYNGDPKMSGSFPLDGHHGEKEKSKVADAVKEATSKNNPDVSKDNLSVDVIMKSKNDSGGALTEVTYLIGRDDDGDVEDIKIPTDIQLDAALSGSNLALHVTKVDNDDDDWQLILAICLGVVAFVLIMCVVAFIIYRRRRQRMADLKRRGEDIREDNVYDKEHFSEAAQFENPAYETISQSSTSKILS